MNQQQVVSPPQLISQDQIARRFMTKTRLAHGRRDVY